MPKKSSGTSPFEEIDKLYQKYFAEASPGLVFFLRLLLLVMVGIAGFALLLGLGIFVF